MEAEELIKAAMEAKEHAYVPYSHFRVGAALLTKSGKVYQPLNVMQFLVNWLTTHLKGEDKQYSSFFKAKGVE